MGGPCAHRDMRPRFTGCAGMGHAPKLAAVECAAGEAEAEAEARVLEGVVLRSVYSGVAPAERCSFDAASSLASLAPSTLRAFTLRPCRVCRIDHRVASDAPVCRISRRAYQPPLSARPKSRAAAYDGGLRIATRSG